MASRSRERAGSGRLRANVIKRREPACSRTRLAGNALAGNARAENTHWLECGGGGEFNKAR